MKFFRSDVLVWERDLMYPRGHENAYKWVLVPGYLCEEEPGIGIHKDRKKYQSLGWKITVLDVGQFSNKEHVGKLITYRKTLKAAKEVVRIIHENIDEFNMLMTDGFTIVPEWLRDVLYGESEL